MSTSQAIEPSRNGGHQLNPLTSIKDTEIDTLFRLAKGLAMSGFFKDAKQAEQAFAKLLFGRDMGLGATQAMTGIHIVEGKPELSANLQAAMVRMYVGPAGERYDYRVSDHTIEGCTITFFRRYGESGTWEQVGVSTYTMEDARRADLASKGNYRKHPRNMVFARALSDGVAFHCPEVAYGHRIYAEGEIAAALEGPAPAAQSRPPALPDPQPQQLPPAAETPPHDPATGEVINGTANEVDPTTIPEGPAVSDSPPLQPVEIPAAVDIATSGQRREIMSALAGINLGNLKEDADARSTAQRLLKLATGFKATDRLPRTQVPEVLATIEAIRQVNMDRASLEAVLDVAEDLGNNRQERHKALMSTLEKGISAGKGDGQ